MSPEMEEILDLCLKTTPARRAAVLELLRASTRPPASEAPLPRRLPLLLVLEAEACVRASWMGCNVIYADSVPSAMLTGMIGAALDAGEGRAGFWWAA